MKSPKMMINMRRFFIAGMLFWIPIWVTLLVIRFIVNIMDRSLALIPHAYRPEVLLGFRLPGLGIILSVTILIVTGMLVKNILGRQIVKHSEALMARIPLVRTIYVSVKQVMETIFATGGQSFRRVLLVEYPRKGLWSLAFQTGGGWSDVEKHVKGEMINIFIPTTPNPTSGYLMFVPRGDVVELDISIDEALKIIISMGVVVPNPGQLTKKSTQSGEANSSE